MKGNVDRWVRDWTVDVLRVDPGTLGVAGLLLALGLSGVAYGTSMNAVMSSGGQYILSYLAYMTLFVAMVTFPVLMRLPLTSNRIARGRRTLFVAHVSAVVVLSVFFSMVIFSELFLRMSATEFVLVTLGDTLSLFIVLGLEAAIALPAIRRRLLYQPRSVTWLNGVAALAAVASQVLLYLPSIESLAGVSWEKVVPALAVEIFLTAFFGLLMQDMYIRYNCAFVTEAIAQVVIDTNRKM